MAIFVSDLGVYYNIYRNIIVNTPLLYFITVVGIGSVRRHFSSRKQ